VAEPFAVTTKRQLSPAHPVYVLLEPHLAYTLAVNGSTLGMLKSPGSLFDQIYSGELAETRQILIESYQRWSWSDLALPADLLQRGVLTAPRDYPFRDDALLWLPALDKFVRAYLSLYYRTMSDIESDWELQAWARELTAHDGGNIRGLFSGTQLSNVNQLGDILTQLLFIAGPTHAAVHFPQSDYFTYVPAFPGAACLPPPDNGELATLQRWRDTLPPLSVGANQFLNNQIANYRYDRFGDYRHYPLNDVQLAQPAITALKTDLNLIEATINARNQTRPRPYRYLLPSLVPNSINI
jgi:arachidonate 15-lipoxygenase